MSWSFTAPGVADLASAGNWANEFMQAEQAPGHGNDWAKEFLDTRGGRPGPTEMADSRWAQDYLEQTEAANWSVFVLPMLLGVVCW